MLGFQPQKDKLQKNKKDFCSLKERSVCLELDFEAGIGFGPVVTVALPSLLLLLGPAELHPQLLEGIIFQNFFPGIPRDPRMREWG